MEDQAPLGILLVWCGAATLIGVLAMAAIVLMDRYRRR